MAISKPAKKLSPLLKNKESPMDRTLRMKKKEFEQRRLKNGYKGK